MCDVLDKLRERLGEGLFLALLEEAGGSTIYVPSRRAYLRLRRDAEIRELRARGARIGELARIYRLTPRHVRRIIAG